MIALFHGEYGLPGIAATALFVFALVYFFDQLAKGLLKKVNRSRRRHQKRARKIHRA
jgi:hypothetical protein